MVVCVDSCLPYPSRLSTPVTLTLALSRRAGEGSPPLPVLPLGGGFRVGLVVCGGLRPRWAYPAPFGRAPFSPLRCVKGAFRPSAPPVLLLGCWFWGDGAGVGWVNYDANDWE